MNTRTTKKTPRERRRETERDPSIEITPLLRLPFRKLTPGSLGCVPCAWRGPRRPRRRRQMPWLDWLSVFREVDERERERESAVLFLLSAVVQQSRKRFRRLRPFLPFSSRLFCFHARRSASDVVVEDAPSSFAPRRARGQAAAAAASAPHEQRAGVVVEECSILHRLELFFVDANAQPRRR